MVTDISIEFQKQIRNDDMYELIDTYLNMCNLRLKENELGVIVRNCDYLKELLEKEIQIRIRNNLHDICERLKREKIFLCKK